MGKRDKRIDAYIEKSADFAKPILKHLREVVHAGCPDVEETMKWSFPHFDYSGRIFCSMAAFKQHCTFGFWQGALIVDKENQSADAMGQFGRITSLKELPSKKVIVGYIKQAMKLTDDGVTIARKPKAAARKSVPLKVPPAMAAALKKSKKAQAAFDAFPPSHRKEYIEWIVEAKTEETRERRIKQAIEWIAEGKSRHWKYKR